MCACVCLCVSTYLCFRGRGLGWTVEGWSASNPWEWNAFPFVALQFLTGLPQHMSMMGLFLLSSFPGPPPRLPPHPSPSSPPSDPVLPVPKAIGIPGGHQWSSFRGKAAGSWVASCARAPRGGDNVLLIDWASWAECRNSQEGETEKEGWGMSWEGWRGGTTREDSQSTDGDSWTSVSDLFLFDSHCYQEGESCGNVEMKLFSLA